jgi:cbb3-type cytochrome oxidase subunit 1
VPPLTRWFIKSALVYLVVSLLIGVALAAQGAIALPAAVSALMPVYFHLFMVGWVTQIIFGVAYWMFPRVSNDDARGSERLALVTYVTLNLGLIARAIVEPMLALRPAPAWTALLIVSAVLQWLGALAFAANTWRRAKGR